MNSSKLNKLENKLRFSNYSDKKEMLNYIKMGIYDFDEDILYDILMVIIEKDFPFIDAMNNAKMLYEIIVFDKENIEEKNLLLKFLSVYNKSGYDKIANFKDLYVLFEDKKLFLVLYEKMKELDGHKQTYIYHYINRARTYFVDEIVFFSSLWIL